MLKTFKIEYFIICTNTSNPNQVNEIVSNDILLEFLHVRYEKSRSKF